MSDRPPMDAAERAKPASEVTEDWPCLECGYNLRGLSGEVIRCPECGQEHPVELLRIPPRVHARYAQKLEHDLTVGIIGLVVGAMLTGLLGLMLAFDFRRTGPSSHAWLFMGVPALICLSCWFVGCRRFGTACGYKPGWLKSLVRYQTWALLQFVAVCAVLALLLWALLSGFLVKPLRSVCIILCVGALACGIVPWIRWTNRQARRPLGELQHEAVVRMVRKDFERWLRRRR